MENLRFYEITCRTQGCSANGLRTRGTGPYDTDFMCGACGNFIEDAYVSPDQDTKDGCIAFCPDSENHNGWAECVNAAVSRGDILISE